ncbi:hypothetical protein CDL12_07553 [Handroanthus impetiginosus]|uniref:Uncharacterized protein n=1 Tax=Handroanthus impetiginosus TaxID=429701 RepID=A0A2G9HQP6_9LAMI|nr:hypothetical protein CDL12_07553 [Handroanthus impetiginosus]
MELLKALNSPLSSFPLQKTPISTSFPTQKCIMTPKTHFESNEKIPSKPTKNLEISLPTMSDIINSSRAQNLDLKLQKFGPFFRITAKNLTTERELGKAQGVIRVWFGGKILHLDSMRLNRETIGMEKSIFGIGLFIGAVAIRYGYECGCEKAELLAINDTDLYHSKLVRFYKRIGFNPVYEVTGSSLGDLGHMLVWGGVGTRMDANLGDLMIKWCSRFKPNKRDSNSVDEQ